MRAAPPAPAFAAPLAWVLLAWGGPRAAARLILSEVMADPARLPDGRGEYLELANAGDAEGAWDGVSLSLGADSLRLGALALPAGGCLLLCRDTVRAENGGLPCGGTLGALPLPNDRPLVFALRYAGGGGDFAVPAARPGVAWENSGEAAADYSAFIPAPAAFGDGDRGSPGRSNAWVTPAPGPAHCPDSPGGAFRLDAPSRSGGPGWDVEVEADFDWDGLPDARAVLAAERACDSAGCGLRLPDPGWGDGLYTFRAAADTGSRAGGSACLVRTGGGPRIAGICPAPARGGGEPEWVLLRNTGHMRSCLARMVLQGMALADAGPVWLGPGDSAIVAADSAAWRRAHPASSAPVLEPRPWKPLRNLGDTLRLGLRAGDSVLAVDAAIYPASAPGAVWRRDGDGAWIPRAPGAADWGWSAARALAPGDSLAITVAAPPGGRYSLGVYDFAGREILELARDREGPAAFAWRGEGRDGRLQPPGPYILLLRRPGRGPWKRVAVLAGKL